VFTNNDCNVRLAIIECHEIEGGWDCMKNIPGAKVIKLLSPSLTLWKNNVVFL
jgi:hypothetical protein